MLVTSSFSLLCLRIFFKHYHADPLKSRSEAVHNCSFYKSMNFWQAHFTFTVLQTYNNPASSDIALCVFQLYPTYFIIISHTICNVFIQKNKMISETLILVKISLVILENILCNILKKLKKILLKLNLMEIYGNIYFYSFQLVNNGMLL